MDALLIAIYAVLVLDLVGLFFVIKKRIQFPRYQ